MGSLRQSAPAWEQSNGQSAPAGELIEILQEKAVFGANSLDRGSRVPSLNPNPSRHVKGVPGKRAGTGSSWG